MIAYLSVLPMLALGPFPIAGPSIPEYTSWTTCLEQGAQTLSRGPDAADLVAHAVMEACSGEEAMMRANASVWTLDEFNQLHDQLLQRVILRVISHRAERKLLREE